MTPDHEHITAILGAYREGWFPMADPDRAVVEWVQPQRRALIPLAPDGLRVSRSLRQRVRSGRFTVRADTSFESVIRACAEARRGREQSWIDESIVESYTALHRAGHAHSVEAFLTGPGESDRLVGGLYGVHAGAAFFGESMFSRPEHGGTDASKVCLVHLVHHLRRRGFQLLDTQLWNPHTGSLGAVEVPRADYLKRLARAWDVDTPWLPFEPERSMGEV